MVVWNESFRGGVATAALLFLSAGMLGGLAACSSSSSAQDDPTTRALNDPMGYHGDPSDDKYDISGGGLTDFHSDAFKRDMNDVLNP